MSRADLGFDQWEQEVLANHWHRFERDIADLAWSQGQYYAPSGIDELVDDLQRVDTGVQDWEHACRAWVRSEMAHLVSEVFGTPFRPVAFDLRWRTSAVRALAQGIYAERAFDQLPILADALQDAGCEDGEMLGHCRAPGPHVRGCWLVDLLLGRS
jgi:hypothetical protein